jgi:cardiolipin synthase (CMP-forming)
MKKLTWKDISRIPMHEWRLTFSTMITIMRIILAPCVVVAMMYGTWGKAFILFVIASLTDFLDGNVARLLNEQTFLGACLDPIADKILLVPCFMTLAFIKTPLFIIPLWFVLVVLIREFIVLAGALMIYFVKGDVVIKPTLLSKLTTMMQMIFIVWLFACYFMHWEPTKIYYAMLSLLFVLVVSSLLHYVYIGINQLRKTA